MKNIGLLLFALCLPASSLYAQAFQKNDIIINAGIGLGLYGTHSEYVNTSTGERTNDDGGAASLIVPITAEYAISNKWGAGLQMAPAFYANDSTNKKTSSFSLGVFGAYHFFTRDRIELYGRLGFGFASLQHREEKPDGEYSWRLGGAYIKPSFGMRTYISTHVGLFADLAFSAYGFSAGEYKSPNGTVNLEDGKLRFNATGVEISTGIAFKF
ncbi:MAG: hypothetical protein JWM14_2277 [Chitinophagaceae bacterium]|nr:hypothetical protein [Chitinophagaceae bacterium]